MQRASWSCRCESTLSISSIRSDSTGGVSVATAVPVADPVRSVIVGAVVPAPVFKYINAGQRDACLGVGAGGEGLGRVVAATQYYVTVIS